ncbi:MAG TPA: ATP-binding protein [Anaerolineaceae bacterium]|nr:ATP-binding protein [Anaerolineaceae bacterium]
MDTQTPVQLTPEILVPRLGDYLVEKGIISLDDLKRALNFQKTARVGDLQITPLLGQILIDWGLIDRTTLEQAITELIIQLRSALQDANEQLEKRVQERTAELEMAFSKLSELNQLKSNFVGNISHELRTPLTHLNGYLDVLLAGDLGELTGEQKRVLKIIRRSASRLDHLIEDLILFSMSEREPLTIRLEKIDIANLCSALIDSTQTKAQEQNIILIFECQEDLPLIQIDEQKISWVILQLLDNAIKFTMSGGKVTLKVDREENFVRIAVIDTGIGIPTERIDEIFEPFHQLDGSSSRKYAGTGLGLALVRKIIEAHGSVIHVKSEVGKGSQFDFLISSLQDSV